LQESPQGPETDDATAGPPESSMSADTEQVLWQLLVGDERRGQVADETRV
jgi:hypothetical protein